MISYETFCRLRQLLDQQHWTAPQVAVELGLDVKTVRVWAAQQQYHPRPNPKRPSKLDPFKADIARWLEQHPFSATQILARLREAGYAGGYSILKDFIRSVRPHRQPAYLTLSFAPGECAQIDWGCAGALAVGSTRRRLSFLVMVLCYSRKLYVEFTLAETMEQFLAAQQNALTCWGGSPASLMIDNLKTAVLSHPSGQPAQLHPRYLDFARHYGVQIKACNVRAAHEKGRVENGVGYVKKNFLAGLTRDGLSLAALNAAAWRWLEQVANVRLHGETKQKPDELFALEKPHLQPLPPALYDVSVVRAVQATSRFRVHFDGNRYSVPAEYAGARLSLHADPQRLRFYHGQQLLAEHLRSYDRNRDFENPDHVRALLAQRRRARDQKLLQRFLQLSPCAEDYYRQLVSRRFHAPDHVARIVALSELYGVDAVARALADACQFQAYSADYIANILEARRRQASEAAPGALHLTRSQDLLELDLPEANLSLYPDPTPNPAPQEDPAGPAQESNDEPH
jgi:transposase